MPCQSDALTPVRAAGLRRRAARLALCAVPLLAGLTAAPVQSAIVTFEAVSANPAGLTPMRDSFRAAIGGGAVAGANGDFGGLRREINWDGVPDARADPNLLPANFFNVNSPRGAVFSTPGTGFLVSANAGQAAPTLYGFPLDLQTFSAQRLFATLGSRVTDILFFVPGTTTVASTSAFGAVFVDVEDSSPTSFTLMEFFDPGNNLIYSRNVMAAGNQGLSFLGGAANAGEQIGRVRITTPDNFLVAHGVLANANNDFVVMDDFLYATPKAVPEPAGLALTWLGLAAAWMATRRRKAAAV
jgi:hypothetical protein